MFDTEAYSAYLAKMYDINRRFYYHFSFHENPEDADKDYNLFNFLSVRTNIRYHYKLYYKQFILERYWYALKLRYPRVIDNTAIQVKANKKNKMISVIKKYKYLLKYIYFFRKKYYSLKLKLKKKRKIKY